MVVKQPLRLGAGNSTYLEPVRSLSCMSRHVSQMNKERETLTERRISGRGKLRSYDPGWQVTCARLEKALESRCRDKGIASPTAMMASVIMSCKLSVNVDLLKAIVSTYLVGSMSALGLRGGCSRAVRSSSAFGLLGSHCERWNWMMSG